MDEPAIRAFWNDNPCGEKYVGGLSKTSSANYASFFDAYDAFRYQKEGHILRALDRFDFHGKRVLEIGLGQGADSEQLIRRGAIWSGLDLTEESVDRVRMRMALRNLPVSDVKLGSALNIPHADNTFDMVFSHGVLHHIPDIRSAQSQIHRVLKPGGRLIAMLYAKNSLNYQVSIRVVRRLGLAAIYLLRLNLGGIYECHRQNAMRAGLLSYLKMKSFIHRSTDGPGNPYAKVYDRRAVAEDFPDFVIQDAFKMWMHAPPLPTRHLPGEGLLGWHLWVTLAAR